MTQEGRGRRGAAPSGVGREREREGRERLARRARARADHDLAREDSGLPVAAGGCARTLVFERRAARGVACELLARRGDDGRRHNGVVLDDRSARVYDRQVAAAPCLAEPSKWEQQGLDLGYSAGICQLRLAMRAGGSRHGGASAAPRGARARLVVGRHVEREERLRHEERVQELVHRGVHERVDRDGVARGRQRDRRTEVDVACKQSAAGGRDLLCQFYKRDRQRTPLSGLYHHL